ncbi:MAG: tetratricopeptide repeat protein [Methanosarcinales archaeon]|nr:tetratricopeptide repeat protein [Methanosarcinales archaeon]
MDENTSDIVSLSNEDEILYASVEKLKEIAKNKDKRFIIFVENLHELFRQLGTEELKKLRAIFQKQDIFSVVASAPMVFPGISGHDEPFYNFFDVKHLIEFSPDEINELIRKIAEIENNADFLEHFDKYEEKIRGMVHLAGGSPRLILLFYELITREELEDIEKAFLKILDEHTPYYQEIFQLLAGQQRIIFDVLLSASTPVTPKQISEKSRIASPTVTTQLRRLEKDGYIISRPKGKHTYYEVRERLFRLWREMRQPLGRKRVSILLEFLQLWYSPEERTELFKTKFELLQAGDKAVLKDLCYYAEALPPESKTWAIVGMLPEIIKHGELEEAAYEIQKLKEVCAQNGDEALEYIASAYDGYVLYLQSKFDEALKAFIRATQIKPDDRFVLFFKGQTLKTLGKHDEALEVFDRILEINPEDESTLINKGELLGLLGKFEEALQVFNHVLEINAENEIALLGKGISLGRIARYNEALKSFDKVLEINTSNEFALLSKSVALMGLERYIEALDLTTRLKDITINESHRIHALLIQAATYLLIDKKKDAIFEIEQVAQDMAGQKPDIIEKYIFICFAISLDELKERNHGNAIKFMEMAHDASAGVTKDQIISMVVDFLKDVMKSKDIAIIKIAVDEIIRLYGDAYNELLKPIINALDIIESKDTSRYYNLQVGEREIVADIVRDITQSDELLP